VKPFQKRNVTLSSPAGFTPSQLMVVQAMRQTRATRKKRTAML
jgi:hypothetical protein